MTPLEIYIQRYNGRLPTEFDPKYLEILNMSKYRIKEVPDVSPGKCGNCGASKNDERKYVDIGLHIDWYGALFLCTLCLTDICNTAGVFDALLTRIEELKQELEAVHLLKAQGEALHETVMSTSEEIKKYYASLPSSWVHPSPDDTVSVVDDPSTNSTSATDGNKSNVTGPKSRATKSTSSSGRENVSSLAELLNAHKQ